jgi:predicted DNA-binding protein
MPQQTEDAMAATSLRLRSETRDRLNDVGKRNESYDVIINRILDENLALKQAVKLRKRGQ